MGPDRRQSRIQGFHLPGRQLGPGVGLDGEVPGGTRRTPGTGLLGLGSLPGRREAVQPLGSQDRHLHGGRGVEARIGIGPVQGIQGQILLGEIRLPEL